MCSSCHVSKFSSFTSFEEKTCAKSCEKQSKIILKTVKRAKSFKKLSNKTVKKSAKSCEKPSKTILKTVKKLLYRNKIKDND